MKLTLIGIGCGSGETMTAEAIQAIRSAELIIGAGRLLAGLSDEFTAPRISAVSGKDIFEIIKRENRENTCILYSGDSGFYSGTRKLLPFVEDTDMEIKVIPGVSSVQFFAARLGVPWHDWNLFSAHGVDCNAVNAVMQGKPAFFLTGGALGPAELCGQLCAAGLGELKVIVGENLSYETECIHRCKASEAAEMSFDMLSVLLAEAAPVPEKRLACGTCGIPDDMFIRGSVPMTKRDIRAAAQSRLAVRRNDVIWDIGAGTGSVSVELALSADMGHVYAVECTDEGIGLIEKNRQSFGAWNISAVKGTAPEALAGLPDPDAVFIGGSRGRMKEIVGAVLERNDSVRICITAIALETLEEACGALRMYGLDADVTQISVSSAKPVGGLHMMIAGNPVFLITGRRI